MSINMLDVGALWTSTCWMLALLKRLRGRSKGWVDGLTGQARSLMVVPLNVHQVRLISNAELE